MISKELMPIAWHRKRWWNFCISEDEKKGEPIFTEGLLECTSIVCNMGVLKDFGTENCVWIFHSDFFSQNVSKCSVQKNIKKDWI